MECGSPGCGIKARAFPFLIILSGASGSQTHVACVGNSTIQTDISQELLEYSDYLSRFVVNFYNFLLIMAKQFRVCYGPDSCEACQAYQKLSLKEKQDQDSMPSSLFISASTVSGAGSGVFCKTNIPAGTFLGFYKGEVRTLKDVEAEGFNAYIYSMELDRTPAQSWVIDAQDPAKSNWTRSVNHSVDAKVNVIALPHYHPRSKAAPFTPTTGPLTRTQRGKLSHHKHRAEVLFVTRRAIKRGEELFLDYGELYNNFLRDEYSAEETNPADFYQSGAKPKRGQ